VQHAGKEQVVNITTFAGQESAIFNTVRRLSDGWFLGASLHRVFHDR
jgi:hypothetical protein